MDFEKGNIYHVYNQGNNKQLIFFSRRNYEYFLRKIRLYIIPYADILAWCLMPNHFHLMLFVRNTHRVTSSHPVSKEQSLNDSIAIMLRSYTRGINQEQNRSGSLFREETKAICLTIQDKITSAWFSNNGITQVFVEQPEKEYPQVCFNYIHNNPVNHGFVYNPEEWAFSSYREYKSKSGKILVNKFRAKELGLKFDSEGMT